MSPIPHALEIVTINKDPSEFKYYNKEFSRLSINNKKMLKTIVEQGTPMSPTFLEIVRKFGSEDLYQRALKNPKLTDQGISLKGAPLKRYKDILRNPELVPPVPPPRALPTVPPPEHAPKITPQPLPSPKVPQFNPELYENVSLSSGESEVAPQAPQNKKLEQSLLNLEKAIVEKQISDKKMMATKAKVDDPMLVNEEIISPEVVSTNQLHNPDEEYSPIQTLSEINQDLNNFPGGSESGITLSPEDSKPIVPSNNIDNTIIESGPFAVSQVKESHPPKYNLDSILFYFGSTTKPEWDLELENNVFSSGLKKEEIIKNSDAIINNFGSILFVFSRKSDTLEEFHELIQLQFCYLRNLARGTRTKMALVPVSSLTAFANKLNGTQQTQPIDQTGRNDNVLESVSEAGDQNAVNAEDNVIQPTETPQQGNSVQVQIAPNVALNNVIEAYRNRPLSLFNKPIFNKSIQDMTKRHNQNFVGANSGQDPFNLFRVSSRGNKF